jgi:hypothetical protein
MLGRDVVSPPLRGNRSRTRVLCQRITRGPGDDRSFTGAAHQSIHCSARRFVGGGAVAAVMAIAVIAAGSHRPGTQCEAPASKSHACPPHGGPYERGVDPMVVHHSGRSRAARVCVCDWLAYNARTPKKPHRPAFHRCREQPPLTRLGLPNCTWRATSGQKPTEFRPQVPRQAERECRE